MCQHMHTMPHQGGLLDQDHLVVLTFDWIREAQATREELQREEEARKRRHSVGRR